MPFKFILLVWANLLLVMAVFAQYPPAAGMPGSTAIKNDSSLIIGWASHCAVQRGLADIQVPENGYASYGTESNAVGMADGNPLSTVSLGDKGVATLTFAEPFGDKPGFDFAVFENSFADNFLELATVSVSSDGANFYTFPSHSLTDTVAQIATFGTLDPTKIHNLAGKYKAGYGTPFDLNELSHILSLDILHITHVRITDVCGSIDAQFATRDFENRIINDPYPTPFNTGGFDLDGVAILAGSSSGVLANENQKFRFWPNPVSDRLYILGSEQSDCRFMICNTMGQVLQAGTLSHGMNQVELPNLSKGLYILSVLTHGSPYNQFFVKL
jgi:hypothetical protein